MPNIFDITEVRDLARQGFDDLLDGLAKPCQLLYPPTMTACADCVANTIGHAPGNNWVTGGTMPFPAGSACASCGGTGYRADQLTEVVQLRIAWSISSFFVRPMPGVQIPAGTIQTKGYLRDAKKVLQAQEMVVQYQLAPGISWRYKLDSIPVDPHQIVQDRYFFAQWARLP